MSQPPDAPPRPVPQSTLGLGPSAAIAGIIGLIFLSLGMPFGQWAIATIQHQPYNSGYTWPDGSPVAFFDLSGGAAWLYVGEFFTGVALILEAVVYFAAIVRPAVVRTAVKAALGFAVLGCLANVLAIVMQAKAGFYQPIYTLIGLALCAISAFSARQLQLETRPLQ